MKKTIAILAVSVLLLSAMTVTAFAHGHGRGRIVPARSIKSVTYAVCPHEDCDELGYHAHDGVTYRCHYANDGHSYCKSGYASGGCCGGRGIR